MSEAKIQAEPRNQFGKGAARRIRRENKVPAVLYGHGTDPVHITLPGHDTMLALKRGGVNALLAIEVGGTSQLALPKQVQRDPIRGTLEHVDLVVVERGEKVTVDVPIVVTGESAPDTLVVTEASSVSLEAEATHIPDSIEVSVEGAVGGTQIHASDLVLPEGSRLIVDAETLIVNVTAAPTEAEVEAELAEAEADAGIERDATDAEVEAQQNEADSDGDSGDSPAGDSTEPSGS